MDENVSAWWGYVSEDTLFIWVSLSFIYFMISNYLNQREISRLIHELNAKTQELEKLTKLEENRAAEVRPKDYAGVVVLYRGHPEEPLDLPDQQTALNRD